MSNSRQSAATDNRSARTNGSRARRQVLAIAIVTLIASASACSNQLGTGLTQTGELAKGGNSPSNGGEKGSKKPKQDSTVAPASLEFAFVSNASGSDQLYIYSGGTVSRLMTSNANDFAPSSAAGRIVFTSDRNGVAQIFITDVAGQSVAQLTTAGTNDQAALSPDGAHVAFVSNRSGTARLYVMDSTGANQVELATGSQSWTPEDAPAWSPDGSMIAFTSVRTGTSQVFVVPAAGGSAVQVTHEFNGAFLPTWSADGSSIVYVADAGGLRLRSVNVSTQAVAEYATATLGVSEPSCSADGCVAAVTTAAGSDVDFYAAAAGTPADVVPAFGTARQPAILHR
ncbi:MAG TPA: hypothetical protein VFK13_07985 [Gemmatimonadaceae bacterium]|nr:hypothetical protein [Gemmatimonadaceae bacterium]